uniref:Uncharacterized protein n=1 Tax=Sphaerodactylus townsendi TaxID=933632 RepID=A0ACB8F2B5_9SAUR
MPSPGAPPLLPPAQDDDDFWIEGSRRDCALDLFYTRGAELGRFGKVLSQPVSPFFLTCDSHCRAAVHIPKSHKTATI